jgi:ABC-2 type transport system permease protein
MLAIYKRELKSYFTSMLGYVFLAFFLVFLGIYFVVYNLVYAYANFEYVLSGISFIFIVIVPVITMRILAEEKKQKTDQLLFTSPVSMTGIVVGKYLAVITVFFIAMVISLLYPLILSQFGTIGMGAAYGSILGFFLMGCAYLAIGLFLSAVAENQMIAAVLSVIVILMTNLIQGIASVLPTDSLSIWLILAFVVLVVFGIVYWNTRNLTLTLILAAIAEGAMAILYVMKASVYEGLIANICDWLAVSDKYSNFSSGILDLESCIYYISVVVIFLVITVQTLNRRRWN